MIIETEYSLTEPVKLTQGGSLPNYRINDEYTHICIKFYKDIPYSYIPREPYRVVGFSYHNTI